MTKPQQPRALDKNQYKHYLIDEIEIVKKENDELKKTNDKLTLNINFLEKKIKAVNNTYEKLVEVYGTEDCYTCVCGRYTECNCKHLGYVKQKLSDIDIDKLNSMWGIEELLRT